MIGGVMCLKKSGNLSQTIFDLSSYSSVTASRFGRGIDKKKTSGTAYNVNNYKSNI
jgi:hypothetical protein